MRSVANSIAPFLENGGSGIARTILVEADIFGIAADRHLLYQFGNYRPQNTPQRQKLPVYFSHSDRSSSVLFDDCVLRAVFSLFRENAPSI
jgi:hypothetical protein